MPYKIDIKKIIARFYPFLLLPFALLLLFVAAYQFEKWRIYQQQIVQINAQISKLDRELGQLAVLPRLLAKDPRIIKALTINDAFAILDADKALEQVQLDSEIAFTFLMDADGDTIAASNWRQSVSFVGQNYGFRPYFQGAIAGEETSYFAVGATTGIPGYFVAHPIINTNSSGNNASGGNNSAITGVIVVKYDVNNLISIWLEQQYNTVVSDEYGVVIFSSNTDFLYAYTQDLNADKLSTINAERKYELHNAHQFKPISDEIWMHNPAKKQQASTRFLTIHSELTREPWTVTRLVPLATIIQTAAIYVATLALLILVAALLLRTYRHQRKLADYEHNHAQQLAEQVLARTKELEQTQQALIAESNFAMIGRMSAAINHEINQPLASLRLNLASLRRLIDQQHGNNSELQSVAIDSDRTTKRIGRVIETLRNVARQGQTEFTELSVNDVLTDVIDTINRERPQMATFLRVDKQDSASLVSGNAILLQQALLNLIYNAFDAVARVNQADVLVKLQNSDTHVVVDVHDNGSGVSPALGDNIFEPFTTGENSTHGLGLGLTLASQIARDHNGMINYQTSSLGGSHFSLSIPALDSKKKLLNE